MTSSAIATVTGRGQVTIPAEVRRRLGLKRADQLRFVVDDAGRVYIERNAYTLEDIEGILPPLDGAEDSMDERIRSAKDEHARESQDDWS